MPSSWSQNSHFRLILVLSLGKLLAFLKYLSTIQEARDETYLVANFSYLPVGPRIRTFVWFWFYFLGSFLSFKNIYRLFKKLVTKPIYWLIFPAFQLVPEFVLRVPILLFDKESYQRLKKMVLDAAFLRTQNYKVRIKGKVKQSRKRSSALPYTLV